MFKTSNSGWRCSQFSWDCFPTEVHSPRKWPNAPCVSRKDLSCCSVLNWINWNSLKCKVWSGICSISTRLSTVRHGPSSSASGNDTRQPCVTLDLRRTSQTDGTSDSRRPMALFIWHNTQTLAFSPISSPAATPWSWASLCWLNGGSYFSSACVHAVTRTHTWTCTHTPAHVPTSSLVLMRSVHVCQGNWCFLFVGALIHSE